MEIFLIILATIYVLFGACLATFHALFAVGTRMGGGPEIKDIGIWFLVTFGWFPLFVFFFVKTVWEIFGK